MVIEVDHAGTIQDSVQFSITPTASHHNMSGSFDLTYEGPFESRTTDPLFLNTDNETTCVELEASVKFELERLSNVGLVAVMCTGDMETGFVVDVDFLTNAGHAPAPLFVNETNLFNATTASAFTQVGTSLPLGGEFVLSFRGERTGYIDVSATAADVESELGELTTVGTVRVTRGDIDENGGYTWQVTYVTDLGDLPPLAMDDVTVTGSFGQCAVTENEKGVFPPFNAGAGALALGSAIVTDMDRLTYTIT